MVFFASRLLVESSSFAAVEGPAMITEAKKKHNFVDALATQMRYALLTKNSRLQILIRPTEMQLRKRGQRGWHLYGTIEGPLDAERLLDEMIKQALQELEGISRETERSGKFRP
jgi:hypothetical protein